MISAILSRGIKNNFIPSHPTVEVFRTNVMLPDAAQRLINSLLSIFPGSRINFDLDDCDRILRVEGRYILPEDVIECLWDSGFYCEVLED